ncbi:MAG: IS66 family insertion sequence element accessory protein TnpA [Planctomycetota bacterium]
MSYRAKYWRRFVAARRESGLSQAEFCRRRKVKAVNFGWPP